MSEPAPPSEPIEPITLTPEALAKAVELAAAQPEGQRALRLYLDGKGCDGFYYGVTFDQIAPEDTVFANGPVNVMVDEETLEFVHGASIEWVDDERGRGFLVNNPRHRKFRGKFYKRPVWKKRMEEKRAAANVES